jgi:hypothetical protein
MKVGDLVVLSAAGQKIAANWSYQNELGIIIQVNHTVENPYQIKWFSGHGNRHGHYWFKRYEIRHCRPYQKAKAIS